MAEALSSFLKMPTCLHIVKETSCTVPCFQRDVAVEEPVVLHAARVLTNGRTLRGRGAVRGCRTGVAPWSVVAPVQRVNRGCMVLMIGRVRMGEG